MAASRMNAALLFARHGTLGTRASSVRFQCEPMKRKQPGRGYRRSGAAPEQGTCRPTPAAPSRHWEVSSPPQQPADAGFLRPEASSSRK